MDNTQTKTTTETKTPAETTPKQPGAGISDPKFANQSPSAPGENKPSQPSDLDKR